MQLYAQLNKHKICIGISQLSGKVIKDNLIEIPTFTDDYIWRKYDNVNNTWSIEKFEPESTAPITEFEQLKQEDLNNKEAIAELYVLAMGGM